MTESSHQHPARFKQIVLIGLSYSGKSTLGPNLSEIMGWGFVDTDREFERKYGLSPADAIETLGEPTFREQESAIIAELASLEKCIIINTTPFFNSIFNIIKTFIDKVTLDKIEIRKLNYMVVN